MDDLGFDPKSSPRRVWLSHEAADEIMHGLNSDELRIRLASVLDELDGQRGLARNPDNFLSYADQMTQIREFIEVGEYGLAYEYLVGAIEMQPIALSGRSVIAILEVGLTLGYKSDQPDDSRFDRRNLKPT